MRLLGLVRPSIGDLRATLYQFEDRWVVDDAKYRRVLPCTVTPLDDALRTTVEWFRATDCAAPRPTTMQGARR